jgi:transportin-1
MATGLPPPPNTQVLSLVSALSQTENHDLHVQAIRAKDEALNSSPATYGNLCLQLAFLLVGCNRPEQMLQQINPSEMDGWRQANMTTALRLESDPGMWIPFGQMSGLILKNALLRPPIQHTGQSFSIANDVSSHLKETLLYGLSLSRPELHNVVSSIIATTSVSPDGVQPFLHISQWPQLMPALLQNIQAGISNADVTSLQGSLSTIRKMMEDGPNEIPTHNLDALVPLLLNLFRSKDESSKVAALQSFVACLVSGLVPSALVMQFSDYFQGLSQLATDPSPEVRKWVCRSINTLLECHTHYVQPHMASICQFMLQATSLQPSQANDDSVAVEACEFWLLFATLDETRLTSDMVETVEHLLPQLIPVLLNNMVHSEDQRIDILAQNEMDLETKETMKPVFHKTKHKHDGQDNRDPDDDDDDDGDFDDDDNEWTLRKFAGASLDSLANVYGAGPILPALLPAIQQGLSSGDAWVQEASILSLGAIAEGCHEEMSAHMGELYPYLMNLLAAPETPQTLPQLKCICAWTVGR